MVVRYDGTAFAGWQTQPNARTVQPVVEAAVQAITREPRVRANCSGRTDAGVHAVGQVVNFYTATKLPCDVLVKAVNSQLPADVSVRFCDEVPQAFCANKDAVGKTYRYVIYDGRPPDPFLRHFASHNRKRLDEAAMAEAAEALVGRHDFRSFETEWPNRLSSVRTITRLDVRRHGEYVMLDVSADGFLYNMVRAIAGTLMQVGRGAWPTERVGEVLRARDRRLAGPTAPPEGLFLLRVEYPAPWALPADEPAWFFPTGERGVSPLLQPTGNRSNRGLTPPARQDESFACPRSPTRPNSRSRR
ncbi:MAG: tRNA pseudouridine(38-40) synthase TruA [Gemmataceae bacterium]